MVRRQGRRDDSQPTESRLPRPKSVRDRGPITQQLRPDSEQVWQSQEMRRCVGPERARPSLGPAVRVRWDLLANLVITPETTASPLRVSIP